MSDILPVKNLILREHIPVVDTFFVLHSHLFIYIVGNQHIDLFSLILEPAQQSQDFVKRLFIYPVITVHYFKIGARRMSKTCGNRISVTAVFLVYYPDNIRLFPFILPGYLQGIVFGAIIDDDDLHILSARQDTFNRMCHIVL